MTLESPALDIERLRFSYADGPQVLDIPRLVVGRGERVFLRGPSGSGKSTLLGVASGVLPAGEGKVESLGHDLGALSPAARDAFRGDHIGLVFQMFNLLPYLTLLDNVLLPARFSSVRRARCAPDPAAEGARLLAALGLECRGSAAPPVAELSIGQQQRVAVARALLGRPEMVIADEPTSALDSDARDAFLRVLMAACRDTGAALLFVSHDTALGPLFDRQVSIADINRARAPAAAG